MFSQQLTDQKNLTFSGDIRTGKSFVDVEIMAAEEFLEG
jgi:hypothetical protein